MDNKRPMLLADEHFMQVADNLPALIWIADKESQRYFFNQAWLIFTGHVIKQDTSQSWISYIHAEDQERYQEKYSNNYLKREGFSIQYRLKKYDSSYSLITETALPHFKLDGSFHGFTGTCMEIEVLTDLAQYKKGSIDTGSKADYQQLNEELAAANEEMSAANEELAVTIEELLETQKRLSQLNHSLEEKVAARVEDLARSENSLRSLVMTAHYPLMILRGREWIIEIANQPLVNLWDKTIDGVTGHALMTILPEIADQPFPHYLRQVYNTGIGFGDEEQIFHYNSPEGPAVKYVSYYYDPLLDENDQVCGIIVAADDITAKVQARHLLEKSLEEQQALTEEFAAVNEELSTTIEEVSAANDELAISENRFRSLIRQAPAAICVIRAHDLMIQEVNNLYLELVGKERIQLENFTIWEGVPEAAAVYAPIMQQVIDTGIPFLANEHELYLKRDGKDTSVFVDFVYEPMLNTQGRVESVMVLGIDVSDKVWARRNIEEVEERGRLAVEAAEIGTFDHDYISNNMLTSDRFNTIFGFTHTVSRSALLSRFHPEDAHISAEAHKRAAVTGRIFYEARLIHDDSTIHWIRVQGNVYYDPKGIPVRLLGTLLDITEFKRLQQQKDDFISIASHELKTPLTSLKASLQLLERMKNNATSAVIPKLIDQSTRSMGKISELVDDLLNVSRMNEGQLNLHKKVFRLHDVMDGCCQDFDPHERHKLVFEGHKELRVFADENRIEQVIVNFLTNAVKYAPQTDTICLQIEQVGNQAKLLVTDSGPGIDQDKLPYLFERYYRADIHGSQVSGLGLGLYISAEIISRHGGEIGVESEKGKGTTFWFTLPLAAE
jgi:PAS domain S-box-containing protein